MCLYFSAFSVFFRFFCVFLCFCAVYYSPIQYGKIETKSIMDITLTTNLGQVVSMFHEPLMRRLWKQTYASFTSTTIAYAHTNNANAHATHTHTHTTHNHTSACGTMTVCLLLLCLPQHTIVCQRERDKKERDDE